MALAETAEQSEDLGLYGDVEGGGGLVGDEKLGPVDEGHGDENALALASGKLVGVVAKARFWVWQGHFLHGGEHAAADLHAGKPGSVSAEGLGDLVADAHNRVQRGHGLLEDHGACAAAEAADAGFGEGVKPPAGKGDGSGDAGGGRKQAQEGERGGRLAGAGLAYEAEGFSLRNGKGEIVDDGVRAEGDGEVIDFKERGGHLEEFTVC